MLAFFETSSLLLKKPSPFASTSLVSVGRAQRSGGCRAAGRGSEGEREHDTGHRNDDRHSEERGGQPAPPVVHYDHPPTIRSHLTDALARLGAAEPSVVGNASTPTTTSDSEGEC